MTTLFADADTGTGLSLLGIAMCAVNGVFLWLGQREKNANERDRMANDVKVARLEDKVESLTDKHRQCEDANREMRREMQEDRAELADLRRRMDERSDSHRPLDRRYHDDPKYRGPRRRADDAAPGES